jgi:hypothetical protein
MKLKKEKCFIGIENRRFRATAVILNCLSVANRNYIFRNIVLWSGKKQRSKSRD